MSKIKEKKKDILPSIHDASFCFTKGVKAFQNLRFEMALKWLEKAIDLNEHEPVFQCQLAVVHTEMGSFYKANELLQKIVRNYGKTCPDCFYLLANNFVHLSLLEEAEKNCKLYLQLDPQGNFSDDAQALLDLIEITKNEEEFDQEDYLLQLQEEVFDMMEYDEYEKALPLLKETIELFPDYTPAKHYYAEALFFTGDQIKAIKYEEALLNKKEDYLFSIMNLALFLTKMNHKEEASKYINILQNIYPLQGEKRLQIANILSRIGYYKDANNRFTQLKNIYTKTYPSYYRWFSYTNYKLGNDQKAKQIWQEGIKRFPKLQTISKL